MKIKDWAMSVPRNFVADHALRELAIRFPGGLWHLAWVEERKPKLWAMYFIHHSEGMRKMVLLEESEAELGCQKIAQRSAIKEER